MAITLRKEELSFGYFYLIGQNRVNYNNILSQISNLEVLENFLIELDEFYIQLPETEDISLYSDKGVVLFQDVRNPDASKRNDMKTKDHVGGDQQFINSSLKKKEWLYELLNNRINELRRFKGLISENKEQIVTELPFLTIEEIYDFLNFHFKIDLEKEDFTSEENHSFVTISGSSFKLWKTELTKYMIGYMFKFFFEEHLHFHSRLIFRYNGKGIHTDLYYNDTIKSLKDKEREIKNGITSDVDFKTFKSNLDYQIKKMRGNN